MPFEHAAVVYSPEPEEWEHQRGGSAEQTTLTSEFCEAVCALVRRGMKPRRAVVGLGHTERSYDRWVQRADAGKQPFAYRIGLIRMAEAQYLGETEAKMADHRDESWQACDRILTKRLRTEYGDKLEVARTDAADPAQLTREELMKIAAGKS